MEGIVLRTTLKRRMMRLGIIIAGVLGITVSIIASISILAIEFNASNELGNYIVSSVSGVIEEEISFLGEGLATAAEGDESDVFENIYMNGSAQSYDYSEFSKECSALESGKTALTFNSSANVYLFALKRSDGVIIGELEPQYFDAAVAGFKIHSTDKGYITNKSGTAVLALNRSEYGKKLSGDSALSANISALSSGKAMSSNFPFSEWIVFSAPIASAPEYGVVYCSEAAYAYSTGFTCIVILFAIVILLSSIATLISILVAKKISGSITPTSECLDKFSRGVIDTSFVANSRGDETEVLSTAMQETISKIGLYIKDIDHILSELANGNLTVTSSCVYDGDFSNIKVSLDKIAGQLKGTITTLRQAGQQVSDGAGMLAQGAQSLAENSATEAGTLQHLDTLVKELYTNVGDNTEMTERMRLLSKETIANVETGNRDMSNLSTAIEEIRKASEEIQTITKLIDSIAFQTNILALNAAVEAARAGNAGKGFAVVADEVRNLAGKSAEAAKDAVEVINRCTLAVNQGVELNESATRSLSEIYTSITAVGELVEKVAEASEKQAADISTVNNGLTSITSVVQSNAATAQQSAASSEELSSQAAILDDQLGKFRV